ncbi:MAG: hypothetical protein DRP59_08115, partial [Spirochaetes bacterium]
IGSDALLKDAIRILLEDPLSRSIYVVNDDGKLAGIVSTLMLLKVTHYLQGKKTVMKDDIFNAVRIAKAETIKDIMHPPIYVYEDTKILDVLEMLSRENIQELPVVDKDKRVIGDLNCLEILKRIWEE